MKRSASIVLALISTAFIALGCGSDGGGDDDDGGDGGVMAMECEDGVQASDDSFLPFSVGNTWVYQVTKDIASPPEEKRQELEVEEVPPGETEPALLQRTIKPEGTTVSWLRKDGDVIVRVRQEDYDRDGLLEQITTYKPPRIRFDASAERIAAGATFSETYTRLVTDSAGLEISNIEITDAWTIVGADVPCMAGWGEELSCLHVRRERIIGGVANKEYYFAKGYGKVLESGGQSEELVGCALQ